MTLRDAGSLALVLLALAGVGGGGYWVGVFVTRSEPGPAVEACACSTVEHMIRLEATDCTLQAIERGRGDRWQVFAGPVARRGMPTPPTAKGAARAP